MATKTVRGSTKSRLTAALYDIYHQCSLGAMTAADIKRRHKISEEAIKCLREMGVVVREHDGESHHWKWICASGPSETLAIKWAHEYREFGRRRNARYAADKIAADKTRKQVSDLPQRHSGKDIAAISERLNAIESLLLDVLSRLERGAKFRVIG